MLSYEIGSLLNFFATHCNISPPPLILSTNTVGKRKEEEKTYSNSVKTINIFPKQMYTVSCKAS